MCGAELPADLLHSESDGETEAPDNSTEGNAAAATAGMAGAEESEAESSSSGEEESEEEEDSEEEEGSGDKCEGNCGGEQKVNVGIDQTSAAIEEPVDSGAVEVLQAVVAAEPVSTGLEAIAA